MADQRTPLWHSQLSRRRLLKAIGATAVGAGLPALLAACGGGASPTVPSGGASGTAVPAGGAASPSAGGASPAVVSSKQGKLSLFVGKNTANPQAQQQLFKLIEEAFHKTYPNVSVSWDTYASASEELTKIETSAASGTGPDIFEFGSTLVPTAYATGAFDVFTNDMWAAVGGQDRFFKPQLQLSGPSPDKYIAVPEFANTFALVYNTRMFKEAGISGPPKSWNDFVDAAKKLTNTSKNQWGTAAAYADSYEPWHHVWLFAEQLGGSLVDAAGKGQFTTPEVLNATSFWLDWLAKFKIDPSADATYKGADILHAFANGQAAMLVMQGPGLIPTLNKSPVAKEYAYAPNPTIPYGMTALPANGKPAQAFVAGQYLTVFKRSQNKDLALAMIKTITSPEIQYQIWKLYGNLPVTTAGFQQQELEQEPWTVFRTAIENAYPTPFLGSWGQLEVSIGHAVNRVAAQIASSGSYTQDDLKKALEAANAEYDASLKH